MAEIIQMTSATRVSLCEGPIARRRLIWADLAALRRKWRDRRVLAEELLPQPDSVLADAGWTREALKAELRKPFWRLRSTPSGKPFTGAPHQVADLAIYRNGG